jgi:hypothetical protein
MAEHDIKFPVEILQFRRNSREIVKVDLNEFKGRIVVDARTFYLDEHDYARPTKRGLTLAVGHLPQLVNGLVAALNRARELGLLTTDGAGDG